jgi:hypothetical protein
MKSVEQALQPLYNAQQVLRGAELRVHPEVLNEIKRLEEIRTACNDTIETEKKARKEYDTRISKAREQVEEAKKYQDLKVALPYWEQAVENFRTLSKVYPKRIKILTRYERAQENITLPTCSLISASGKRDPVYQKQLKNSPGQ